MFGRLIDFWDNHVERMALALMLVLAMIVYANSAHAQAPDNGELPPELVAILEGQQPMSTSEWHRFDTVKEAAMYAADRLGKCSKYYECSAVFVKDPKGKIAVGPASTDYQSDATHIRFSSVPSDWERVGAIHSHPCVPHHHANIYSGPDIMGSLAFKIPFYMVDLCSGQVHEFIPGVDPPNNIEVEGAWMTAGRIIGTVQAYPSQPVANEGI